MQEEGSRLRTKQGLAKASTQAFSFAEWRNLGAKITDRSSADEFAQYGGFADFTHYVKTVQPYYEAVEKLYTDFPELKAMSETERTALFAEVIGGAGSRGYGSCSTLAIVSGGATCAAGGAAWLTGASILGPFGILGAAVATAAVCTVYMMETCAS